MGHASLWTRTSVAGWRELGLPQALPEGRLRLFEGACPSPDLAMIGGGSGSRRPKAILSK